MLIPTDVLLLFIPAPFAGLMLHIAAATLSVAAIFQTSPLALNLHKAVGSAYLVFLALQAFIASAADLEVGPLSGFGGRELYFRGINLNVTNPKVALFFLAFLPQFSHGLRGSLVLQMLLLGSFFMTSTLLVFGAVVCFAGYLGDRLQRSSAMQKALHRVAGTIFLGLAVRLLMTYR